MNSKLSDLFPLKTAYGIFQNFRMSILFMETVLNFYQTETSQINSSMKNLFFTSSICSPGRLGYFVLGHKLNILPFGGAGMSLLSFDGSEGGLKEYVGLMTLIFQYQFVLGLKKMVVFGEGALNCFSCHVFLSSVEISKDLFPRNTSCLSFQLLSLCFFLSFFS